MAVVSSHGVFIQPTAKPGTVLSSSQKTQIFKSVYAIAIYQPQGQKDVWVLWVIF